ncbi:MAG TPA: YihY family inner membrane protein [Arenimonas sp.]|uniref:YihY family inner membrane protein n=1 Tax=Arenimonas sp. TaxID=1872635 RepID=UPI002D7EE5D2|nr:YihY family inner membrane protein [Arenimonas sp.]HEU0152847.1 YihY family inner membrane protein [Arenimonas sp.]
MNLIDALRRWLDRIDRERVSAFSQFLWTRFLDDRCFETAGALAYTTLFALVPLSMVVFGILSAFPVFDTWSAQLTNFVFSNFVPSSARVVEDYLRSFANNTSKLTLTGVVALLVSLILAMYSVESTFNRVWRVPTPRTRLVRLLMYWTLLTLGTLLAVASLAVTSYLFSLPALSGLESLSWRDRLLAYLPNLVELMAFTCAYWLIPHRSVAFRFALAGGLLATLLFELAKRGFAAYLLGVPTYEKLYGGLVVVPIFMLWLYLSWVVVLLGASFAASLSSFRFQPRALQLPPGTELYGYLRLLGRLEQARAKGRGLHMLDLQDCEPMLTDDHLRRMLAGLSDLDIVRRAEDGAWLLSRDLGQVSLGELHERLALRIPGTEATLPGFDDPLGRDALRALDHLRKPLDEPLSRSVGSFFTCKPDNARP